jgi:archaellum component FlaC
MRLSVTVRLQINGDSRWSVKGLALMLVLLVSSALSLHGFSTPVLDGAEPQEPDWEWNGLLALLGASHAETKSIVRMVVDEEQLRLAMDLLWRGEEASQEAEVLFENGHIEAAEAKAAEALRLYEVAVRAAISEADESGEDEFDVAELQGRLERASAVANEIEGVATKLEEEGYNASEIWSCLEDMSTLLDGAETAFASEDFESCWEAVYSTEERLNLAWGILGDLTEEKKVKQTLEFLDSSGARLQLLEDRVNDMLDNQSLSDGAKDEVYATFRETKNLFKGFRGLVASGQVDEVIDGFDGLLEDTYDELGKVETLDKDGLKNLRAIEKVEAKSTYLAGKIGKIKEGGEDTGELEEKVQQTEDAIEEAVDDINRGQMRKAERELEKAEELVEETENDADKLEKTVKGKGKGLEKKKDD